MTPAPSFVIELPEGSLGIHDLTVGAAPGDAPVVLAVHGITANGLSWRRVADEVDRRYGGGTVRFLAPDLRGRAESRAVPGPYGLAAHVEDLASIASVFGAQPVLVGHSMGAFVAALAGAAHPERFSGVVLVDGGLAFPSPAGLDLDAALQAVIGPAMSRLSMRFPSEAAYLDFWSGHPALGPVLRGEAGDAVRRYLLHDLVPAGDGSDDLVSSCVLDAVRADGADVLAGAATHAAVRRCVAQGVPVEFLWAARGLLDEPQGLYDRSRLDLLDVPAQVRVTAVDANHYSVILDPGGAAAVAEAVGRQLGLSS
ncbi:MAG TPA: alpha/beta fold hydrolase [Intrasporangium sp.]|uniref:alpha/beta hydrolase n=1 Tax=Intrasporangium sp. TaxID=1925024 RepID=UPI002D765A17|nr:alpha/beta fold hydrolase [Intrasporangium sp.]HET7399420.1 alpha/beta fold hydrolase [Intrasporangium sp.]